MLSVLLEVTTSFLFPLPWLSLRRYLCKCSTPAEWVFLLWCHILPISHSVTLFLLSLGSWIYRTADKRTLPLSLWLPTNDALIGWPERVTLTSKAVFRKEPLPGLSKADHNEIAQREDYDSIMPSYLRIKYSFGELRKLRNKLECGPLGDHMDCHGFFKKSTCLWDSFFFYYFITCPKPKVHFARRHLYRPAA